MSNSYRFASRRKSISCERGVCYTQWTRWISISSSSSSSFFSPPVFTSHCGEGTRYDRVGFVGKSAKTSGYEPRIIENAIPSLDTYFAKSSELLRIDLNANPIRDRFKPRFSRDKWVFLFFYRTHRRIFHLKRGNIWKETRILIKLELDLTFKMRYEVVFFLFSFLMGFKEVFKRSFFFFFDV